MCMQNWLILLFQNNSCGASPQLFGRRGERPMESAPMCQGGHFFLSLFLLVDLSLNEITLGFFIKFMEDKAFWTVNVNSCVIYLIMSILCTVYLC